MTIAIGDVFARLFDVGIDVLGTFLDAATNVITAQTGDSTSEAADSKVCEWWQQTGFVSRAAAPTQGGSSCQALKIKCGDKDIIFATRDTRGAKLSGNLKPGEACVYASAGQARTLYKASGAIVDYTTSDNTPTGTEVSSYVGPDKIQLSNQWGSITINAQGITISTADGTAGLVLAPGKATLAGQQVAVSGALVAVAGSVATCLGASAIPVPGVSSAIRGAGGGAGTACTTVFLGK